MPALLFAPREALASLINLPGQDEEGRGHAVDGRRFTGGQMALDKEMPMFKESRDLLIQPLALAANCVEMGAQYGSGRCAACATANARTAASAVRTEWVSHALCQRYHSE